jgi:hypothetical protein
MLDFRFGIMFLQYLSWIYTWDCIVIIWDTMKSECYNILLFIKSFFILFFKVVCVRNHLFYLRLFIQILN